MIVAVAIVAAASVTVVGVGVVAAAAMVTDWWSRVRGDDRVETFAKPAATVAIGAVALVAGGDAPAAARVAAVIAFVLCCVGDLALLGRIDRFVAGLAAFLGGHIAFAVMFVALGVDVSAAAAAVATGLVIVAATVGRRIVAGAARTDRTLAGAVVAYLTVISTMAVLGAATGSAAATVGSIAFVVSDALLGWNRFVAAHRWMHVAVMMTYHAALVGLALSLA